MQIIIVAIIGISIGAFLEAFFLPVPFVLFLLILLSVFIYRGWIFFLALFAGLLLDSLLFRPIGLRSLFFLGVVGIIFLYSRKFEIHNNFFIGIMTLLSSLAYFLFFGSANLLLQMILVVFLPLFSLAGLAVAGKIRSKVV